MFKFFNVTYDSSNGKVVDNDFYYFNNNSLVVLFPGVNYSFEKPLLYYARKAAMLKEMDVLCIRYGHKLSKNDIGKEIIKTVANEVLSVIKNCSDKKYNNLYFISKSIGGEVAGEISKKIGYKNVKSLYLTPTPGTIQHMTDAEVYTVVGTEDPIFCEEHINYIKNYKNIDLILINKAQHSLEIENDIHASIDILGEMSNIFTKFLR